MCKGHQGDIYGSGHMLRCDHSKAQLLLLHLITGYILINVGINRLLVHTSEHQIHPSYQSELTIDSQCFRI